MFYGFCIGSSILRTLPLNPTSVNFASFSILLQDLLKEYLWLIISRLELHLVWFCFLLYFQFFVPHCGGYLYPPFALYFFLDFPLNNISIFLKKEMVKLRIYVIFESLKVLDSTIAFW